MNGAYTGAVQERAGLLRSASKGLFFLDEVGEFGANEQAMLLRALEEKRFLWAAARRFRATFSSSQVPIATWASA